MKQAACVLIVRDGKVLAVPRPNNPDWFCLPGGNIEPNETVKGAACRELREETGLFVFPSQVQFLYHGGSDDEEYETATFVLRDHYVLIQQPTEGDCGAPKWVDWSVLETGPFGEYNKRVHIEYDKLMHGGEE